MLIGYLLGRFYAAQRPRAGVELAAARLTQRVAQEESAWQEATTGRDYGAAYRIVGYVADQVNAAKPTATTNVDNAQTVLDALAAADGRFDGLRWRVHALVDGRDALFHALAGPAADFPEDPAWLLAVKEPLVLAHQGPDDAGKRIADRDAIVSAAEKVMTDVRAQGHRLSELAGRIEGVDDERFAELERKWWDALDDLFAAEADDLKNVDGELAALSDELDKLEREPEMLVGEEQAATAEGHGSERALLRSAADAAPLRVLTRARPEGAAAGVVTDGDDLVWVSVTLPAGHPDADFVWKFSDGRTSAAFRLTGGADSEVTTEHQFTGGDNTVSATLVDSDGREIGRWAGTVTRPGRAEALRRTVSSDDFAIGVVAFLLAVGSGIVALYLPSATWGSAGDYVTALLWGSATSEGIKAAANVAGKVGPITS